MKISITCPLCGRELNTWDVRVSKALGYLTYQVCENCICNEYGVTRNELRSQMEDYFGMRPCKGI
ncbi:MAG TPA: hypothetical protein DDX59_06640 [Lachnospiraceae bacterium]|nr:hypothetical protein [Lachnospiraceae bacterium]